MPQVMAPAIYSFILACGMLIGSLIVRPKIGITEHPEQLV